MTNTYRENGFDYYMPDTYVCIKCKKLMLNKASRQVERQMGGVNYCCLKCFKKREENK